LLCAILILLFINRVIDVYHLNESKSFLSKDFSLDALKTPPKMTRESYSEGTYTGKIIEIEK